MIAYKVEVDTDGDKHWYLNGKRHDHIKKHDGG